MIQYNVSPTTLGQIPPKGSVMAKRWATPNTHAIRGGMKFVQYENKVKTTKGIHLLNLLSENNIENVQKPS